MTENELSGDMQIARSPVKVLRHALVCTAVVLALSLVLAAPVGAWGADTSWYDTNPGADEYVISTADELAGLAVIANTDDQFYGKTVILGADIDLGNQEWTPIGIWDDSSEFPEFFAGVFDGRGHTISNLYISNQSLNYVGLFGWISSGARISNLTLENVNVTGTGNSEYGVDVGALAGFVDNMDSEPTLITHCAVIGGTVSSSSEFSCVGGLIGSTRYGPEISNCYAEVTVTGNTEVGGMVGNHNQAADMNNCYAKCTLTGSTTGGLVGFAGENSQIISSYAKSVVNDCSAFGGIIGSVYGGNFTDCFASFDMSTHSSQDSVGGIVGSSWYYVTNITNCYSTGSLDLLNSYALPHSENNGGLIGSISSGSVNIINSVALMQHVDGSYPTGRLAGNENAVVVNSYAWEGMTNNGSVFSEGGMNGTSVSSAQFWNTQSFFEDVLGWDFTNTWKMNSGNANAQLPVLQFMQTPVAGDVSYLLNSPSIPELKDTYIVGIDAEYPPFTYLDDNGNPTGFDVESILWIAEQQGFDVIIQPTDWSVIIPALNAGQIDMIYSGMSITLERAEQVTFSDPYWDVGCSIVVRTENSSVQVDDFINGNLVIGVVRGSLGDDWLSGELGTASYEARIKDGSIILFDDGYSSIIALENRFVDAVIHESYEVSDYLEGTSTLCVIESFVTQQYAVAMRNDDTALHEIINDGIAELKSSGKWGELAAKHMGVPSSNPTPIHGCHNISEWQPLDSAPADISLGTGYYYLTNDIELSRTWNITGIGTNVHLCLNGHNVTFVGDTGSIVYVGEDASFSLYDCIGTGVMSGGKGRYVSGSSGYGAGGVYNYGVFTIFDGSIVNCNSSGVYNHGTFTMVDGSIENCSSNGVDNKGTFTLSGGSIVNCNGRGVHSDDTFIMSGGSIENCGSWSGDSIVNCSGGGVFNFEGTFAMSGGSIENCGSWHGAGVYNNGGTFTMSSGSIVNCSAENAGGGVYHHKGIFTMSGGSIINCSSDGDDGGGVWNWAIFTLSGGSIINCSAADSGGGVYNQGGTFTMSGGSIENCGSGNFGGGVYNNGMYFIHDGEDGSGVWDLGVFTLSGGSIINCSATHGGGMYNEGTFTISGSVDITDVCHSIYSEFSVFKVNTSFIGSVTDIQIFDSYNWTSITTPNTLVVTDGAPYAAQFSLNETLYQGLGLVPSGNDLVIGSASSTPDDTADSTLVLSHGWNFVSVPKALDASCNTAYKLFGSVDTRGAAVLEYNASSQSWEQVTANTVIKPLSAYWIYSITSTTIPLTYFDGPNSPATKSLYPGWNAVGLSAATETAASSFFAGLEWRVAVPWNSENGAYDLSIVNGGTGVNSADRMLSLGSGCWLYVEEADVLLGLTA